MPQYETRNTPTKQRKRSRVLRVRQDVINQAYEDDHKKVQQTYSTDSQSGIHTTINRSVSTQSIQPGYRSGQYSSIGTFAHKSSMPQINPPAELRTFRQESEVDFADFKLLLACVRRWRGYVNEEKFKMRQDGEKPVEDLVVNLHFHEQTLLTKAFISLSRNIKDEKQLNQAFRALKRRRDNCIKRKAFRSLKLGARFRWTRKHLVYAAMNSWAEGAKKRMFDIWLERFKKAQTLREGRLFQFIQHPFSLRLAHQVLIQSGLQVKAHPSERDVIDRELINQALTQCRLILVSGFYSNNLSSLMVLEGHKPVRSQFLSTLQIFLKIAKYRVDSIINDRVLRWSFKYCLNKQREARCIGAQERIAGFIQGMDGFVGEYAGKEIGIIVVEDSTRTIFEGMLRHCQKGHGQGIIGIQP